MTHFALESSKRPEQPTLSATPRPGQLTSGFPIGSARTPRYLPGYGTESEATPRPADDARQHARGGGASPDRVLLGRRVTAPGADRRLRGIRPTPRVVEVFAGVLAETSNR